MHRIDKYFHLKPDSISELDLYLGVKIQKLQIDKETTCWSQSSSLYIKEAIRNVEEWCRDSGFKLPNLAKIPMSASYQPELDVTEILSSETANWYQSAIGMLRWICELGHVHITTETSMLASYMVQPRMGHLIAVLNAFAYFKVDNNACLVHDLSYPKIDYSAFKQPD